MRLARCHSDFKEIPAKTAEFLVLNLSYSMEVEVKFLLQVSTWVSDRETHSGQVMQFDEELSKPSGIQGKIVHEKWRTGGWEVCIISIGSLIRVWYVNQTFFNFSFLRCCRRCFWLLSGGLASSATGFLFLVHRWRLNLHDYFLIDVIRSLVYLETAKIRRRKEEKEDGLCTEKKVTDGAVRCKVKVFFQIAFE